MFELTPEKCSELHDRVMKRLTADIDNSDMAKYYKMLANIAVEAAITTFCEYERMKSSPE